MRIIDGHTGEPHVTSTEIAAYNQAITGREDAVLQIANEFEATQLSNTEIRIDSGVAIVGGIRCGNVDNTENVTLDAGTPGAWRHDLIVIRYTKDPETLVEDCALVALKGTNGTQATATDPEYEQGDILQGAEVRDFPLYRIVLDGANIDSIKQLFVPISTVETGTDNSWSYIKYADGTACAWRSVVTNTNCTNSVGGVYASPERTWSLPSFLSPNPCLTLTLESPVENKRVVLLNSNMPSVSVKIVSATSDSTTRSYTVHCSVAGRWR